jgi:FkbM family methyltransferase
MVHQLTELAQNEGIIRFLKANIRLSNQLLGVGVGGNVSNSGESGVLASLRDTPSPLILDVGANRGQFLKQSVHELQGCTPRIVCFEPSSIAYAQLCETVALLSSQADIRAERVALSSTSGEALLWADQAGSGMASMARRDLGYIGISFSHHEAIRTITLDSWCAANGMSSIDLLRIDVEGFELEVLKGARQLFEKRAIKRILFEFGGTALDTRIFFKDFFFLLKSAGLSIFRVAAAGWIVPLLDYDVDLEQFDIANYFACLPDVLPVQLLPVCEPADLAGFLGDYIRQIVSTSTF